MSELTTEGIRESQRAILDSKAGREALVELVDLADLNEQSDAFRRGFYRQMLESAKSILPDASAPQCEKRPVMTDEQAKRFESRTVGFGKHAELTWGEAPIDYIVFLHEKQEDIGAYLRSKRGQARQSPLWEPANDE